MGMAMRMTMGMAMEMGMGMAMEMGGDYGRDVDNKNGDSIFIRGKTRFRLVSSVDRFGNQYAATFLFDIHHETNRGQQLLSIASSANNYSNYG